MIRVGGGLVITLRWWQFLLGDSGSGVCLGAVGVGVSARLGMVLAYWAQASRGLRCPISFNIFIGKSPRCFGWRRSPNIINNNIQSTQNSWQTQGFKRTLNIISLKLVATTSLFIYFPLFSFFLDIEEGEGSSNFWKLRDSSCFGILSGSILRTDLVVRLKSERNQFFWAKIGPNHPNNPKIAKYTYLANRWS